jgi:stage II sporulation protein D
MSKLLFSLILSFLFVFNLFALELRVKVGSFKRLSFTSPLEYKIIHKDSKEVLYKGRSIKRISVFKKKIRVDNLGIYRNPLLIVSKNASFIKVNKRSYRGNLELRVKGDRIEVVNLIELEDYLYGVVNREMSPKWPMGALKAQAIISRTFALGNLNRHKSEDYNLCSSWHCQVYGGKNDESKEAIKAVNETKGLVLVYKNNLIHAPFHACCGGVTAKGNLVWNGGKYPYLRSVVDPFCRRSPHYRWRYEIKEEKLRKILSKKKKDIGRIYKLLPINKSRDGRAANILIFHKNGRLNLNSNDFRLILNPNKLRSTRFKVFKRENRFLFYGYGWGHGVGLCQWGAKKMAKEGKSFSQILRFYYPGTNIKKYY